MKSTERGTRREGVNARYDLSEEREQRNGRTRITRREAHGSVIKTITDETVESAGKRPLRKTAEKTVIDCRVGGAAVTGRGRRVIDRDVYREIRRRGEIVLVASRDADEKKNKRI